jgi:hypothetical protein
MKFNKFYFIIIILVIIIIFQYFKPSRNKFEDQINELHRKNDSLVLGINQNKIEILRLDSLSNTYKLKVEADKKELANLKYIAEKNKQKYNEEHNRISALSNTAVVSEFTDIFK